MSHVRFEDTLASIAAGGNSNSTGSINAFGINIEDAEGVHEEDAFAAVFLNVTLICCVLLAYYIKKNRIYYLPERYDFWLLFIHIITIYV